MPMPSWMSAVPEGGGCAPDCAEGPSWATPDVESLLDDAATYAVVRPRPGMSQREVLKPLVPVLGRQRALLSLARGVKAGWLTEELGPRRARSFRTVDTPEIDRRLVELLVGSLEQARMAGVVLDQGHRHRLHLLARGVMPWPPATSAGHGDVL